MTSAALRVARRELGSAIAAAWDFMSGRLPDGLTFSRASGGTVFAPARYDTRASTWQAPGVGWALSGGNAVTTATAAAANTATISPFPTITAGKMYRITVRCNSYTSGTWSVLLEGGTSVFGGQSTTGTFSTTINAPTTGAVYLWAVTTLTATFNQILVEELTIWQPGMDWLGPELANPASWTTNGPWTASAGVLTATNSNGSSANQSGILSIGRTYQLAFDLAYTSGALYPFLGNGAQIGTFTSSGRKTISGLAAGDTTLYLNGNSNFSGTISNVTCREQLYTFQQVLLPANVPRFAYDPVTFAPVGLLVEPQRTNLLPKSNDLSDTSAWQAYLSGATINRTPVAGIGPDGGNAWRINVGTVGGSPNTASAVFAPLPTLAVTTAYATAWYVRSVSGTVPFRLTMSTASGTDVGNSDLTATTSWQRIPFAATTAAGGAGCNVAIRAATAGGVVGDLYVACVQFEAGTEPTSYIPTSGAAATRARDVVSAPSPFGVSGMFVLESVIDSFAPTQCELGVDLPYGLNNSSSAASWWNGTTNLTVGGGPAAGGVRRTGFSWTAGSRSLCMNGGPVAQEATVPWPTQPTTISLGALGNGSLPLIGTVRKLAVYRRPAGSPAELRALTR